ncbi:lipoprotein insertase outer membrane protein LolB [Vibrio panuliri]|uniref:Outer-membrane lipoprotein LolB n=1 Tax=Vibrio panuliri TaxID=1381081 RepID=A0A1Q9HK66_9VIBR|nr:lipoprotein insertase outer membrane protein LolB [Vibrio panuliri]KAB1453751.1 lipoprotein localization protein LolB [Vibrio panuliri]OLQ88824.1 lipoprotein localization factor LolB [Vibrio panuliri]OLQ90696.1 lipoprotein localization factor LolB [Vibrio panuliri]
MSLRLLKKLPSLLFSLALLAGCSSIPDSETNVEWQAHQQRLERINEYKATGKLGYISPQQRESLSFYWQNGAQNSELRLSTFLGQTVLNMTITPSVATVKTYDDKTYRDQSADRLIAQLTGLSLPVEQLNDWLLGKPTNADSYTLNETQTLATLTKTINGQTWQLIYTSYQDVSFLGTALPVPSKVKLKQNDTTINLIISKWTLN